MKIQTIAALAAMACAWQLAAQPFIDPPNLNFEQAANLALAARPELARFAAERALHISERETAALKPALELNLALENAFGSGTYSAVDAAELSLSIGASFERGGKRAARIALAQAKLTELPSAEKILALDVLAETGRRFVALAVAQEALQLSAKELEQNQSALSEIAQRVRIAQSPKTELLLAELALSDARLGQDQAELDLKWAHKQLRRLWQSDTAPQNVQAELELYLLPAPADAHVLDRQLDQLPDLARLAGAERIAQAELRLAITQNHADWRWEVGVRRLEMDNDQALLASISVPLASESRNTAAIHQAQLRTEIAGFERQIERQRLQRLRDLQVAELEKARMEATSLLESALPKAEALAQLTQEGWRIGRFSFRELALTQAQVLAIQRRRLRAAERYHLTRIELERLTGASLPVVELAQ